MMSMTADMGRTPKDSAQLLVENIPIYLVDRGAGPPTLMLHGIFDTADTWAGVVEGAAGSLRCLVPDLPGFGRSGAADGFDASLAGLAQFVESLVNELGIREPINVVGYDIGATYGLAWAATHPERVRRLAIMNANFFSDYQWHGWAKVWRTPILGELMLKALSPKSFASAMLKSAPKLDPALARAAGEMLTPAAGRMALKHYRSLDPASFRGWQEKLWELTARVPTLVCWGDQDPYIGPSYAERFGAQQVHHFPENSHWLPLEQPAAIAAHLRAFLGEGR